jgi:hypothetical protein
MLIGYVRVSKSDGTQTLARVAGVAPERIYKASPPGAATRGLALPPA